MFIIVSGRVSRRSRDGQSPGSALTSAGIRKLSPHKTSPGKQEISPRRTRAAEGYSPTDNKKHSPKLGDYNLPRRTRNNKSNYIEESEDATDDPEVPEVDSPFYPAGPHHVRFSPSAKTSTNNDNSHSPFGRKTRSSRRGLSSYIQSLPSEDEQSEFNRHYR